MLGCPSSESDHSSKLDSDPALSSSIRSLPNEILAYIFTIGASTRPRRHDELPFPLLVSSINVEWRDVAVNSPPVWSNLIFANDVQSDHWCATIWLPRSGAHPLDITIDLLGRTKDHIMDLILPHVARWRKLSVTAWDRRDMEDVLLPLRTLPAPLLQHVEFRCNEDEDPSFWELHNHCLALDAPSLKSIRLRGLCTQCAPPLVGLTALHLDSHKIFPTHSELSDLITASPALNTLMLRLLRITFPADKDLPVINIPSLRSLVMNFRHCELTFVHLFSLLSTPALESLELIRMDRFQISDVIERLHLPSCSLPRYQNVHTLKLFHFGGPGDGNCISDNHRLHEFFGLFPNVLSLYRVESEEEFVIHPHLEFLKSITFSSTQKEQIREWLCNEVEGRHSKGQPLTTVLVSQYTKTLDEDVWPKMRDIVEVVDLDDNILRYTGESDDEMADDYDGEGVMAVTGHDDFSDYSAGEWENHSEVDEENWYSD